METQLRELMHGLTGDPPRRITAAAVRRQMVRRRRRAALTAAAAVAAVLAAVIPALTGAYSGYETPARSYLTPLPGGQGSIYHDAAGWMIDVPPGWHVISFHSTKDGATAAGAQISNVSLPAPALVPGAPVQAGGKTLPAGGVSLVIATDNDPRVCRPGLHHAPNGVVSSCQRSYASLPVSFKNLILGSSLGGTPVTGFLWVKSGGTALSLTATFGPRAFSDRWVSPVSTMLASLRTSPAKATAQRTARSTMPSVTRLTLAAAEAKIRSAVTGPRFTIQHAADPLPAGRVFAQIPAAGTQVAPGSPVLLKVSTGTRCLPARHPRHQLPARCR